MPKSRNKIKTAPRAANSSDWNARIMDVSIPIECEVVVIGAGMAGLAAAILLQKAGLRVLCVEPEPFPHNRVGESLDWAAPKLLKELGILREQLIDDRVATYKRKITVSVLGSPNFVGIFPTWASKKPLEFEIITLHVNRSELDQRLFEKAQETGVEFLWERVSSINTDGEQVISCSTLQGNQIAANWYIDASGQARLLSKTFGITKDVYGQRKIAIWTYLRNNSDLQGTTFYIKNSPKYFDWIWEIPISSSVTSVGYVISAEQFKELRRNDELAKQVFKNELLKHSHFQQILAEQPDFKVSTCSYKSYVNQWACGPNWFALGEAASMPDPLTSNGVTSALRHARTASEFIQAALEDGSISKKHQRIFNTNVWRMGHFYNYSIEKIVYELPVRQGLTTLGAMKIYTFFALAVNGFFSKYDQNNWLGITLFGWLLFAARLWIDFWVQIAKTVIKVRNFLSWAAVLEDKPRSPSQ